MYVFGLTGFGKTTGIDMQQGHSLYKDEKTERYYTRIQVGGVRKKFWFGKNFRAAEQECRQLEADIHSGKKSFAAMANLHIDKSQPHDLPIRELVDLYLNWLQANRALKTYETNKYLLTPFVSFFGDCMVSDLNTLTLVKFYGWAKLNLGKSENGGNDHLRRVKTMLRWGEEMEICICPVRRFPAIREAPARTKKFTDDELVTLLRSTWPDFRDMIVLGLLTGLRPQELRELRREHIRHNGSCWSVVLERHKTSKSAEIHQARCVPLSPEAVTIVQRQIAQHPEAVYIFLNGRGVPYRKDGFRQRLNRACTRAKIEKKPPYALRHYFGTKRAASGLNQTVLAQLMGHTKLQTTSRYIAAVPEYHQKAMEAMEADLSVLFKTPQKPIEDKTATEVVREWPALRLVK